MDPLSDLTLDEAKDIIVNMARLLYGNPKPEAPRYTVDWSNYKDEFSWFAIDESGRGFVYTMKVKLGENCWYADMGERREIGWFNLNDTDWRKTSCRRPGQPPAKVDRIHVT